MKAASPARAGHKAPRTNAPATPATPATPTRDDNARSKLLLAAERLLVVDGRGAWTLRRLAQDSGCNSALVAYYFGQLHGLLRAVVEINLQAMVDDRSRLLVLVPQARSNRARLRAVIEAYVRPLWLPCVLSGQHQAGVVIDEALSLADADLHGWIVQQINTSVADTVQAALPLLPHLDETTLLMRLRLLLGAALAAQARPYQHGLLDLGDTAGTRPQDHALEQTLRFAEGALLAA
jgi:AcrR family transcriptional regulator